MTELYLPKPESRLADKVVARPMQGGGFEIIGYWEDVGTDILTHVDNQADADTLVKAWTKPA